MDETAKDLFNSNGLKYILTVILLLLQFSLKLFLDRKVTTYFFALSVFELPTNIFFISLTLIAGYILTSKSDVSQEFIFFIAILLILIFSVVLWRRSVDNLEKKKFAFAFWLCLANYFICLPVLIFIIFHLSKIAR